MTTPALDPDQPDWPADAIEVGRILGAWGVKGWVKVKAHASDPKALFSTRRWYIDPPTKQHRPGVSVDRARQPTLLRVTQAREHGDGVVAKFDGSEDRASAESWKGAAIYVPRSSFPTAAADEFYWVDLIGLAVINRQGESLGKVTDLIDTGAHCVLRIETVAADSAQAVERLVPFVAAYVDDVSLADQRITVDWGLDY